MIKKIFILIGFICSNVYAGGKHGDHNLGEHLPLFSIIPFAGILISIAVMPLVAPHFWHRHFGKVSAFWALIFFIPFLISQGFGPAFYELLHVMFLEYIPFIILLFSLFTVAGGICMKGELVGTPKVNLGIISLGTALASWMGTTGAAMLLIRPLIRANKWRKNNVHLIIFFIFLVANIGGSLTPLGDPPLFLGFLQGVSFFWTTTALFKPMMIVVFFLLIVFYIMDHVLYSREKSNEPKLINSNIELVGLFNFILIVGIVLSVLLSGFWKPGIEFNVYGVHLELQNIVRDVLLLIIAYISWVKTDIEIREMNGFTWFPIVEVAKLFAGIFITIIPAIAILKAGEHGALAAVINAVSDSQGQPVNIMYFWLTGLLSGFLDNAPTYLVFFNTAGGNAEILMTSLYYTLLAISCGAVFMGAMTYIGNAPNFMVKSIAEENDIKMPSFFGYMMWSGILLLPIFIFVSLLYF